VQTAASVALQAVGHDGALTNANGAATGPKVAIGTALAMGIAVDMTRADSAGIIDAGGSVNLTATGDTINLINAEAGSRGANASGVDANGAIGKQLDFLGRPPAAIVPVAKTADGTLGSSAALGVGVTAATVEAVEEIGSQISEIDEVAASVAAAMEEQHAATSEISRSVTESAVAAKEVSSKIVLVSRDADSVDARATEVRSAITGVSTNLSSLKSILIKVIRTTTDDADRRQWPRYQADLPIRVTDKAGRELAASLVNISAGGAWIRCQPDMTTGEAASMTIRGYDQPLPFTVRGREADSLRVEFDLGHQEQAYQKWFSGRFAKVAA
jgi:archaellum component FlaC